MEIDVSESSMSTGQEDEVTGALREPSDGDAAGKDSRCHPGGGGHGRGSALVFRPKRVSMCEGR